MRSFAEVAMPERKRGTDSISHHRDGFQSNGSTMFMPNKALNLTAYSLRSCVAPASGSR